MWQLSVFEWGDWGCGGWGDTVMLVLSQSSQTICKNANEFSSLQHAQHQWNMFTSLKVSCSHLTHANWNWPITCGQFVQQTVWGRKATQARTRVHADTTTRAHWLVNEVAGESYQSWPTIKVAIWTLEKDSQLAFHRFKWDSRRKDRCGNVDSPKIPVVTTLASIPKTKSE